MIKILYPVVILLFVGSCYTGNRQTGQVPLIDTTWNLAELNDRNIEHTVPQVPHIRFTAEKVTGNDGCNNFFGSFKLNENNLSFGQLGSTRMACPHIDELDIEFNRMISMTTAYRITGNKLEFFANDKLLASFHAVVEKE